MTVDRVSAEQATCVDAVFRDAIATFAILRQAGIKQSHAPDIERRLNDAQLIVAALSAEVERLREDAQWRPIETAPKEIVVEFGPIRRYGVNMLLLDHGEVVRGRWWQTIDGASNFIADGGCAIHPTHWKPLPEPPAQDAGAVGGEG